MLGIKNPFDRHAEKSGTAEEKIDKIEDGSIEIFQTEIERERRKKENNLRSLSTGLICI